MPGDAEPATLIEVWHATGTEPVRQECETFGWPSKTTCGEAMFVNTHFRTQEEAWAKVRQNVEAGVRLAAQDVEQAEGRLARALAGAGEAVKEFAAFTEARERYERERADG